MSTREPDQPDEQCEPDQQGQQGEDKQDDEPEYDGVVLTQPPVQDPRE